MLYSNSINPDQVWRIPSAEECYALWDTYDMLDNIRTHCALVAKTALLLVQNLTRCQAKDVQILQKKGSFPRESIQKDLIIPKYYMDNFADLQKKRAQRSPLVSQSGIIASRSLLDKGLTKKTLIAAGLLHDIAKTYTIKHGGDHAMLGATFVRESTGNPYLAHAVYAHIAWHWTAPFLLSEQTKTLQKKDAQGATISFQTQQEYHVEDNPITLPLIISYADKRVTHSQIVTLDERFENLYERYGKNEKSRSRIHANHMQAKALEQAFITFGMDVTCTKETVLAMDLEN